MYFPDVSFSSFIILHQQSQQSNLIKKIGHRNHNKGIKQICTHIIKKSNQVFGFVGWIGGGMKHSNQAWQCWLLCQILGGSGILHIESMLVNCNM